MQPSDQRRPGPPQWALRLWPLWILAGIALIVIGVIVGGNLSSRGGPFVLGLIVLIGGIACAIRAVRSNSAS